MAETMQMYDNKDVLAALLSSDKTKVSKGDKSSFDSMSTPSGISALKENVDVNREILSSLLATTKYQMSEAMLKGGMTADQVLTHAAPSIEALQTLSKSSSPEVITKQPWKPQGNFWYSPTQINPNTGEVSPANILGGLISESPDVTNSKLEGQLLGQKIVGKGASSNNPEEAIKKMADLNKKIDEVLPGYQTTQTADGNFVIHPKSSGILAQMSATEMDSVADKLTTGGLAPSQLPRMQKAQALAAAFAKDPNYNPAKADIEYAVNKVGTQNFEKLYNNVTSFEKTFRKNADVALAISDKFPRNKIPLINKAIMAGKTLIEGDPEASKMATALNTVAIEYARLTSSPGATGSQITDSAREEAQKLLNVWQNEGTIRAQLDPKNGIMSVDAQNRIDALDETRAEIKGRYAGKKGKEATTDDTSILKKLNLDPNKYEIVR